mmetsp:Transcript_768/g.1066  ORF Transcript_768/g.1066 Transcript_768/m.1066 type:complete len:453 (+) Transcript_768:140-1498(+)
MLSPTSKDRPRKRVSPSSSDDNNVKNTPQPIKSSGLSSPFQTLKNLWNGTPTHEEETPSKKSKKQDDTDVSFITSSPKPGKASQQTPSRGKLLTQRSLAHDFATLDNNFDDDNEKENEETSQTDSQSRDDNNSNNNSDNTNGHPRKKTSSSILNTLFSPMFHIFGGQKADENQNDSSTSSEEPAELTHSDLISNETLSDDNDHEVPSISPYQLSTHESSAVITYSYVDDEDAEEEDEWDFDPFSFIANLPEPSFEQRSRPMRLPAKTKDCKVTLVLDLDETLVHCSTEPIEFFEFSFPVVFNSIEYKVYVRKRPHFEKFLKRVSQMFEVVVFTASQEVYASQLLNILDPENKYIQHRLYRDACVCVEGNYLKDLTILGRDLSKVVIVDNSPQAFGYQVENGIPIESWFDNPDDTELLKLLPFLDSIANVDDVRPFVRDKFKLVDRIRQLKAK